MRTVDFKLRRPVAGVMWIVAGVCVTLIAIGALAVTASYTGGMVAVLIASLSAVLVASAGGRLINHGKRLLAPGASTLMQSDRRSPVLYLRSFADDGGGISHRSEALFTSFEQRIEKALRRLGPVVAVGRPNESLPELGAARLYVSEEQWRHQVVQLMHQAQLVILGAGVSQGVLWEFQTATRRLRPDRLVIFLPYPYDRSERSLTSLLRRSVRPVARERRYSLFKRKVKECFPKGLPERIGDAFLIVFKSDWSPVVLDSNQPGQSETLSGLANSFSSLRPRSALRQVFDTLVRIAIAVLLYALAWWLVASISM